MDLASPWQPKAAASAGSKGAGGSSGGGKGFTGGVDFDTLGGGRSCV